MRLCGVKTGIFNSIATVISSMAATLRTPTDRVCERCGRIERWDDEIESWVVDEEPGEIYCIHEWDINGSFAPIES